MINRGHSQIMQEEHIRCTINLDKITDPIVS
jgi:hypothetical protein